MTLPLRWLTVCCGGNLVSETSLLPKCDSARPAKRRFAEERATPREDWRYRVLHARTPNGYHLTLEENAQH